MELKTVFDNVPVLLFYKDKENKFVKVNKLTADFYGHTIESLEGKSCYDLLPEEQAIRVHEDDLDVVRTGKSKRNIIELITNVGGEPKWFRTDKVPLRNEKNEIIGIVGFAIDITDQVFTEKELVVARKAIEQAPSTVVITNSLGDITFVNDKFTQVTGYSYKEVLGKNPKILKSGKMSDNKYRELWDTISSGNVWRGEFINKTKNGQLYWELATVSPVYDDNGMISHYVKVAEVLSEMKNSILNMWNILEYANYYVVILDRELKIVLCNKIFARVIGYKESLEMVSRAFTDFISDDDEYIFKSMQVHISTRENEMSEFLSELVDNNGRRHMVKWFNSWINSDTHWTFCFGVPIKDDTFQDESVDTMRERYRDIISIHRELIHELKETHKKEIDLKKKT